MTLALVLGSGAADHIADDPEAHGYKLSDGAGSNAGRSFVAACGQLIPTKREMNFELQSGDAAIASNFQVANIPRPLWSVGKTCDAGYKLVFDSEHGTIYHKDSGKQVRFSPTKG